MVTCARKKPKSVSSASANIIGCSEDLIDQILIRLPVRSLIRFKSVSKQWNTLISDPRFSLTHTLKNSTSKIPSGLLFYNSDLVNKYFFSVYSVSFSKLKGEIPCFPNPYNDTKLKIVQSCNGLNLVCFESSFGWEQHYCIYNIVTHQLEFVPLPESYDDLMVATYFLAFDPSVSSHYKILCIQEVEPFTNKILMFSSETGQWKDTGVRTNERIFSWKSAKGVYMQGAIYCLVFSYLHRRVCYRFDVEAKNLTEISLPSLPRYFDDISFEDPRYYTDSCLPYFGEFNGHLHLVYVDHKQFAKKFDVFELDHVSQKWFVKYRVNINRLISRFPEVVGKEVEDNAFGHAYFSILCVVREEKEGNSAILMAIPGKVVSYNFRSRKFRVLSELPTEKLKMVCQDQNFDFKNRSFVFPFIPTLYPL